MTKRDWVDDQLALKIEYTDFEGAWTGSTRTRATSVLAVTQRRA